MSTSSIARSALVSFIALAVLAAACGKKEPGYFRDRSKGFSVVFPNDWEVKTEGLLGATVVQALSPLEEKGVLFRENVNISVEELSKDVGLSYYREITFENIARALGEFREVERNDFTLDGRKAVMTVFTHRSGALRLKVMQPLWSSGTAATCWWAPPPRRAFRIQAGVFRIPRSMKLED